MSGQSSPVKVEKVPNESLKIISNSERKIEPKNQANFSKSNYKPIKQYDEFYEKLK